MLINLISSLHSGCSVDCRHSHYRPGKEIMGLSKCQRHQKQLINKKEHNISFVFDIRNNSLVDPKCVFWNFSLFNGLGGWDDEGCMLGPNNDNKTVTCNCKHLTSFSILMSPYSRDDPGLDYVTYIGVGISMASLVICLIIEAVIWRKIRKNNTSYLRHVSIVNIAVSLLTANIWFIIGAAISDAEEKNPPACSAATFFIHFFYLALFFWMLASALLLLYRAVSVFEGGLSKRSMLAIGFCLGYGAPLIIATITIAVTAPEGTYIRDSGEFGCAHTIFWINLESGSRNCGCPKQYCNPLFICILQLTAGTNSVHILILSICLYSRTFALCDWLIV
uniref:Uncharacterized protein n=1 Tax=Acanthochromis polyacanthus TaxID=80966 RepID=A0A3Q1FJU2_9TELE